MPPPPFRIAVLASGEGTNLGALLERFPPGGHVAVALVVADRDAAGALRRARAAGVPAEVLHPLARGASGTLGERLLETLERHAVHLVVLAGFLRKVPPAVVAAFRGRIINVHPAPLPEFGGEGMYGRRVHEAVLAAGARESGPTVHFVDEEYDRGPVIAHEPVPVLEGDLPETLAARVLTAEHRLLPRVVGALARGDIHLDAAGSVHVEGGW
ncbi:MAG: phosphoribosylglycinamide formyltransferase [Gemmatimonadota bacterium]